MNVINLGIKLREGGKMFACFLLKQLILGCDSRYIALYTCHIMVKNDDELSYVRMKCISLQL